VELDGLVDVLLELDGRFEALLVLDGLLDALPEVDGLVDALLELDGLLYELVLEDDDDGLVLDADDDGLEDDEELLRVLAVDLLMAVTAEHCWNDVVVLVAIGSAVLLLAWRQVKLTTSPAWTSLRLATAFPCTGRVVLADVVVALAVDPEAVSALRTVMVLDDASTETTSAVTMFSLFF